MLGNKNLVSDFKIRNVLMIEGAYIRTSSVEAIKILEEKNVLYFEFILVSGASYYGKVIINTFKDEFISPEVEDLASYYARAKKYEEEMDALAKQVSEYVLKILDKN